jgi:hypothetical protein
VRSAIKQNRLEHVSPLLLLMSWNLGIRIGIKIVEDRNALNALRSETVQLWALELVHYLRAYPKGHATTVSLVLAGLGLPTRSPDDRKEGRCDSLTIRSPMDFRETQRKGV